MMKGFLSPASSIATSFSRHKSGNLFTTIKVSTVYFSGPIS